MALLFRGKADHLLHAKERGMQVQDGDSVRAGCRGLDGIPCP